MARLFGRHMRTLHSRQPDYDRAEHAGRRQRLATNYMYTIAPKDGTTSQRCTMRCRCNQALGGRACAYDAASSTGSGSTGSENSVITCIHSGVETIEER